MHVVFPQTAGLSNRLRCIAFACRLMQPNEHLYIHWRRKVMADRFSDLFSLNGIPYTEDDGENWPAGAIDTWSLDRPGEDLVDNKYKAVPPDLLESYKAVFSKIGFNARSQARADALGTFEYAIHVRVNCTDLVYFTDLRDSWPDTQEVRRPISMFTDLIQSLPSRVYLSCHNAVVQQEILATVDPEKVRVLPGKDFTSLYDAVSDMIMLGRATHFFAHRGSSFSDVSWWLGGCKGEVTEL